MNEQNKSPEQSAEEPKRPSGVDQGRRRLGTLGVGSTAAVLSVTSRSAVAGWGSCTGSELASGNLSRQGTANPCGCSPGFWWNNNGTALWNQAPSLYTVYPRTAKFNTVFGVAFYTNSNIRLMDVGPSTNHANAYNANGNTGMHAVAALLNAKYYGARYPVLGLQTAAAVIAAFQTACALGPGNRKAQLEAFVAKVDIYGKTPDLWCNGARE